MRAQGNDTNDKASRENRMSKTERKSSIVEDCNTFKFPVCNQCKWNNRNGSCKAFLEGIPHVILIGGKHDIPLKEQVNDIVFAP